MKIQFEVDITPEELRRLCGLPDMTKVQNMMVEQMAEKMKTADMETMKSMMKPFIFDGVKSGAESYQNMVGAMLKMATMGKVNIKTRDEDDDEESETDKE